MIKLHHALLDICLEVFCDLHFTMPLAMVSSFSIIVFACFSSLLKYVIGGANGCIDFTNSDNSGLQIAVDQLQPIYLKYASIISRADFWVLAANVVILYASTAPTSCKYSETFYFSTLCNLIFGCI